MNIKEFIKETISQIANGSEEINGDLESIGAYISDGTIKKTFNPNGGKVPVEVEFDIAVIVTESHGANGDAGIKVASLINIGGGVETKAENQIINHVKFTLPLILPDIK